MRVDCRAPARNNATDSAASPCTVFADTSHPSQRPPVSGSIVEPCNIRQKQQTEGLGATLTLNSYKPGCAMTEPNSR